MKLPKMLKVLRVAGKPEAFYSLVPVAVHKMDFFVWLIFVLFFVFVNAFLFFLL